MGVRGLRTFIQSVLEKKRFEELGMDHEEDEDDSPNILNLFEPEILPKDSVLLVDASSFLFYLLKSNPSINFATFAALGGDYSLLDQQIRQHVEELEFFGLELKFILDGRHRSNTMKQVALKRRLIQREAAWTEMFSWCNKVPRPELDPVHEATEEENPLDLPIPPLCFHQLVSTLKSLQVDVIEAPGEADDLIAEICSANPSSFCYAMDSDYLAMRDCRYIEIGSITRLSVSSFFLVDRGGDPILIAQAPVWTRSKSSALLGLTEHQFVEMCILLGNDYTEGFDFSKLSVVSSSTSSSSVVVEKGVEHDVVLNNKSKSGAQTPVTKTNNISTPTRDEKERQSSSTPSKLSSTMSFGNKVTFARSLSSDSRLGCPTDDAFEFAIKYSRAFYNRESVAVSLKNDKKDDNLANGGGGKSKSSSSKIQMESLEDNMMQDLKEYVELCAAETTYNKTEFSKRMHPLRFLEHFYARYPTSSSEVFSFDKVLPREYVKTFDLVERMLIVKNHNAEEISELTNGLIVYWPPYKQYLGLYYFQLLVKSMNNMLERLNYSHSLLVPAKVCNGLIFNILMEHRLNGSGNIFPAFFSNVINQAHLLFRASSDDDDDDADATRLEPSTSPLLSLKKNKKSEKKPLTPTTMTPKPASSSQVSASASSKGSSSSKQQLKGQANVLSNTPTTGGGGATTAKGQVDGSPSKKAVESKGTTPNSGVQQRAAAVTPVQESVVAAKSAVQQKSVASTPVKSSSAGGNGPASKLASMASGTPQLPPVTSKSEDKSKANQKVGSSAPATGEKASKAKNATPKPTATPVATPSSATKPVSTPATTAKPVLTPTASAKPVSTPVSAKPAAVPATAKPFTTPAKSVAKLASASKSASKAKASATPGTGVKGPQPSSSAAVAEPSKSTTAVKGSTTSKTPASSKREGSKAGGGSTGAKSNAKVGASPFAPRQLSLDHHSTSAATPKSGSKQHPSVVVQQQEDDSEVKVVYKEPEAPLPIEGHRQELLKAIRTNVVTIVQGETGCGKSTKIPEYVYRDCQSRKVPCKMMLCQPRRLATYSLLHRLRSVFGDVVGMRMGNDTRDESKETRIWVVTTGYLMQLLASMPHYLVDRGFTHLIVDEVHERSVECDVTVYLARELLLPDVKLVLMSATANAGLYQSYFKAPQPLFVGARRYPVDIYYLDELADMPELSHAPIPNHQIMSACVEVDKSSSGKLSPKLFFFQANMVKFLVKALGHLSRSILVFVSGMQAILDLFDAFAEDEAMFRVLAVHSEIPFEEQTAIFNPTDDDPRTRVILATNAAESSITLPDVDLVICLGTQKELVYDPLRHTSVLAETFISKSSATQRAGRTGRVREGTVIRLYPRAHYENVMSPHETVEILRKPLDDTILQLRSSFENGEDFQGVVPILSGLIQPPDMSNVKRSFTVLFREKMITRPNDNGKLTSMGKFASTLNIGYRGSQLIAKGIALGVGAEAVVLAAAICQPKTVFRIASKIIHTDPTELYEILRTVTVGAMKLDGGVRSEPLMMLQLFKVYSLVPPAKQSAWLLNMGIVQSRLKQFVATARYLLVKLAKDIPNMDELFEPQHLILSESKLNRLRFLLFDNCQGAIARLKVESAGFHHCKYLLKATGALKDKVTPEIIEKQLWPASIRNALPGHPPVKVRIEPLPFGYTGKMRREVFESNDTKDWAGRLQAHYVSHDDNVRVWIIVDRPHRSRILCVPESDVDKIGRENGGKLDYIRVEYQVVNQHKKQTDRIDDLEKAFEALRIKREGGDQATTSAKSPAEKKKKQVPSWAMFECKEDGSHGKAQAFPEDRAYLKRNAPAYVYMEVDFKGRTQVETCNVPIPPNLVDFLESDFTKLVPQGIGNIAWTQEDYVDDPQMEFKDVPLAYKLMVRYKACERNKDRAVLRIVVADRSSSEDNATGTAAPLQICEVDSSIDMPKFIGVKVERKREFTDKTRLHHFKKERSYSDYDDFDDLYSDEDFFSSDSEEEEEEDDDSMDSEEEIVFGIEPRLVLISQMSMLCASVHAPKTTSKLSSDSKYLYVITSALSMYGGAFGFDTPTFLPPGGRWLQLACRCSGWELVKGQKGFDCGFGHTEQQCSKVAQVMNNIMLQTIERNDELIDLLDEIFADFIHVDYKRDLGIDLSLLAGKIK